ncbi:hypothetical protein AAY473_007849 [Plecturocebus cupreus]
MESRSVTRLEYNGLLNEASKCPHEMLQKDHWRAHNSFSNDKRNQTLDKSEVMRFQLRSPCGMGQPSPHAPHRDDGGGQKSAGALAPR